MNKIYFICKVSEIFELKILDFFERINCFCLYGLELEGNFIVIFFKFEIVGVVYRSLFSCRIEFVGLYLGLLFLMRFRRVCVIFFVDKLFFTIEVIVSG